MLASSPHGALMTHLAKENLAPVLGRTTLLSWNHPRAGDLAPEP